MAEINVYLVLAITGFFTGMGTIIAQWIFKYIIEPKLKKVHTIVKGNKKNENKK